MTAAAATLLSQIQSEVAPWQVRNFGPTDPLMMLIGMGEEYGEACEHMAETAEFLDAVGDCAIYLMQFCSLRGWDIGKLWEKRDLYEVPARAWPVLLGRINHHHAKMVQRYRGTPQEHNERCCAAISALLGHWEQHLADMWHDFVAVVEQTWREVSARDWTADRPAHGDVVDAGTTGMQRMADEIEGMIPADLRMDRELSYAWANAAWQEGVTTVAATLRRAYAHGILAQGWRARDAAKAQVPGEREETA